MTSLDAREIGDDKIILFFFRELMLVVSSNSVHITKSIYFWLLQTEPWSGQMETKIQQSTGLPKDGRPLVSKHFRLSGIYT